MAKGIPNSKFRCMVCQKIVDNKAGRWAKYRGYNSKMCPSCAKVYKKNK